jgi:N-acetylgalactosamine-6-sulfatase
MPDWLDVSAPSMPRALQQTGYRTAHFGKWDLGGGSGSWRDGKLYINHPDAPAVSQYGFDVVRATFGNAPTWRGIEPVAAPHEIYPYDDRTWQTLSSQAIADAAIEFLDEHASRNDSDPFLTHVWFKDPHTPMAPTAEMRKPYLDVPEPSQTHYAMISFLDEQIGRILARLDALNLRDNTLVLFTSDNGAAEGRGGSNTPLRAYKWYLYEGGIRVPLIVRWPGHTPAGRVDSNSVLNLCDFAPTFCRLAGAAMPANYRSDGIDISEALHGRSINQRPAPMMWHHPTSGKRSPMLAIRDGDWKLLMDPDGGRLELYNLRTDLAEQTSLAAENPQITQRLSSALRTWHASLTPKLGRP